MAYLLLQGSFLAVPSGPLLIPAGELASVELLLLREHLLQRCGAFWRGRHVGAEDLVGARCGVWVCTRVASVRTCWIWWIRDASSGRAWSLSARRGFV